jgi:acetyl-CoA synthetase
METFNPSIKSWDDYLRVYSFSVQNSEQFWDGVAKKQLHWSKPWKTVSDCDFHKSQVSWYVGGELNVSENCLDRHVKSGRADKTALIWIGNDLKEERKLTFRELYQEVCRVANALEAQGIKKGDRVVLYLPNIPELAISVLACARIGAIHSVIFGGFSPASIQGRIQDCGAKMIITADGTLRGQKWVDLKSNVDAAIELGCPTVEKVVVVQRHSTQPYRKTPVDISWDEFTPISLPAHHRAPSHSAQDPLFILYTSGSTGKPKGVLHSMGGYLTYVSYSHEIVFQPQEDDVYWCTADLGWITGHSYVLYGPLANGVTTVMFEGVPTYPDPGRFWQIVDQYRVSIFYTAPTAIRMLASLGDQFVKNSQRKTLRVLGTVGEPINPEAWKWYHEVVGDQKLPIVDTWWQTETGGILISPLAGITPTQPGSATFPLPGIIPKIIDFQGQEVIGEGAGALVVEKSWPGQMVGVYGDPDRFYQTYLTQYPGYYFSGDGATRDQEGNYWITGRMDDVIKISGHRLGSAEVESACITHSQVAESAAIGVPDPITGEALCVFVVLKEGYSETEDLKNQLIQVVRKEVGPLATAKRIIWAPGLPKTRSGKIMRRVLRKIAAGETESLGDLSTLADPTVVDKIIASLRKSDVSSADEV